MAWTIIEDVDGFAAAAGPMLRDRPAPNTVLLTVSETLRARGPQAFGQGTPMFGWWQDAAGAVSAACLQTPPFPLLLSDAPEEAVAELAARLAAAGRPLSGVNSAEPTARAFAARWGELTGAPAAVHQRHRLYRLGTLVPPSPVPAGRPRLAGPADRDLLIAWLDAFATEAGELTERDHDPIVDDRLGHGGLTLWEDGGAPVSLAGTTRQIAGMTRVGPVYTPPALRRRGYAAGVTAAVTQAALDAGAAEVLLFTDLANPTSNGVYQRIGYQPVEDRVLMTFG
jgi:predicted GNAT family acetyltransferase